MSNFNSINSIKSMREEHSPTKLLKKGIDSIVFLFENKNNEYSKNLAQSQIIISNLEAKIRKLIKENNYLKQANASLNKLVKELKDENTDLKNIINNIKGSLNIDTGIILKNNNKIKINKLNINNVRIKNRTRNISNLVRHISPENKEIFFSNREKFHRKNNVLVNNINKGRDFKQKLTLDNFDNNSSNSSEYSLKIKDNYYSRQRSKNHSINQYFSTE